MAEEKIEIKSRRPITVARYFTNVQASRSEIRAKNPNRDLRIPWQEILDGGTFGYALKGQDGNIADIIDIVEGSPAIRIGITGRFRELTPIEESSLVTGITYDFRYNRELNESARNATSINLKEEIFGVSGSSGYGTVKFFEGSAEDYNVDITIHRTFDTLDTLSVKNNPLSEMPEQESETGTLVGTLIASQKIVDEDGEKITIPLSNVPVVLFNSSDEFPQISSTDEDGNRITLNLLENSNFEDYPNIESYILDVGKENAEKALGESIDSRFDGTPALLKSDDSTRVPDKFLYSTITNDKGEFILHNVPVGPQVLMFEVDLLKQGLTKEEVALNNFPYPADVDPNVDSVPHYYFRQIPVNIVPNWGTFQTGYTKVDIRTSLDLRRWGTFFVPPISFSEKNIDELVAAGYFDPLTIIARDMTRVDYPLVSEIVEINDVFNRNKSSRMEWFNEFKIQKPTIEFRSDGYHAFKLPANLYDPEGTASADSDRRTLRSAKGVWLCAYQMKMFYGRSSNVYRATGFVRQGLVDEAKTANHFDRNRGTGSNAIDATGELEGFSIGKFPYEQPWTINYPAPYSIPARPFEANTTKSFSNKVEPRYLDGDLAGDFANKDSEEPNGYGIMQSLEDGQLLHNRFSQSITKAKVYRYETGVAWHDEFSNGYRRYYHSSMFPGKNFRVKDGEQYQRVEAGYTYFMKPEGWGRISHETWGDFMLSSDINFAYTPPANLIPTNYRSVMHRNGEKISIKMDTNIGPDWLETGALEFYRVIDDSPEALVPPGPPFIKKTVKILLQNMWRNKKKTSNKLQFDVAGDRSKLIPISVATLDVRNNGSIAVEPTVGGVRMKINPGETETFQIFSGAELDLPSNVDYNVEENFYARSSYTLSFKNSEIENSGEVVFAANVSKDAGNLSEPPTFYMITRYTNAKGNVKFKDEGEIKCKDSFQKNGTYDLNGLAFERTGSAINSIRFEEEAITPHCSTAGIEIFRLS